MVDGQGSGVQFGWLVPKPQARLPSGVHLQRGEGLQGVEGPRGDGGDLVVIEREEADAAQTREAVIVDAADAVVPQHPGSRERRGESVPSPAAICLPVLWPPAASSQVLLWGHRATERGATAPGFYTPGLPSRLSLPLN